MNKTLSVPKARVQQKNEVNSAAIPSSTRELRLAYLTTEYPKVSHTFIRREIRELERLGHEIVRLSIRDSGGAIVDPIDREEAERTYHCLNQPHWRFPLDFVVALFTRPVKLIRAIGMVFKMGARSDRGLLRHFAYLIEATVLLRELRRKEIDHVHVHFGTNSAAVARLIKCLGGPRYSMTVHGPNEFDAPYGFSVDKKIADATFVVAISDYCSAQLRRWASPNRWEHIHVVRCSVGEDFFNNAKPIPADSNTLVSVGRLSAQKGQLLLIDAFRTLIQDGINATLILVGDGEMRNVIEARLTEYSLNDCVQITGWLDERSVRETVLKARALVQPSFAEGLPVVMMEAFALTRPVISTMIAGIPELVRHGENGWLITAGSESELVEAMSHALTMPIEDLNELGRAGQQKVRENHLTAHTARQLETLFSRYSVSEQRR